MCGFGFPTVPTTAAVTPPPPPPLGERTTTLRFSEYEINSTSNVNTKQLWSGYKI